MADKQKTKKRVKLSSFKVSGSSKLWYQSVVRGLDAALDGADPSKKTKRRHRKAVSAVREFFEVASYQIEEVESKKPKDKKADLKSKAKSKKTDAKKAKPSKKAKPTSKKASKLKKNELTEPLLLTNGDDNVVQLRSPEKLIGSFSAEKASDILSLAPEPDQGVSNSLGEPSGDKDDLKMIAGIGPKLEDLLNGLGIFHFKQIAEWDRRDVAWVDNYLQFTGRIDRDNWIEQAVALAKGGRDEYVKVFGKEPR